MDQEAVAEGDLPREDLDDERGAGEFGGAD